MFLKKSLVLLMSFCLVQVCYSQEIQKEINEQVWRPFIEKFDNLDSYGFIGVHSQELLRCSRDSKKILNWEQYHTEQSQQMNKMKADGMTQEIQLHFTERIANAGQAIDVGIYKTTMTKKDGTSNTGYGKFLVVLKKENGRWKILVDTDSSEGNTISEKDFLAAKPM